MKSNDDYKEETTIQYIVRLNEAEQKEINKQLKIMGYDYGTK